MLNSAPFLSVKDIKKSFGPVKVLHGVNLDLHPGTVTALLGENGAGKSTLVRIIAGDHLADSGHIHLEGQPATYNSVIGARDAGIKLIAQEIADAPPLTVAENISLGALPKRFGFVQKKRMRTLAQNAIDALGADIPLDVKVGSLRLGDRQIIEIARASVGSSRCVIFDEPTAALSDVETRKLFELIARMKSQGVAILYITHRLDEVFEIADRVCVMRDGTVALDQDTDKVTQPQVVAAMVGRTLTDANHHEITDTAVSGPAYLKIENLSGDGFTDIDLSIHRGEIVGLYGKIGSGVPELSAAIFGEAKREAGRIELDGKPVHFTHPSQAIAAGIGFLPPERKSEGLLTTLNVAANLAAPSWSRLSRSGLLTKSMESSAFAKWHKALNVRAREDGLQKITQLSGGNQQKVMLGRWLENGSKLLVLAEPTRGVDVGAREEIYAILRRLAGEGHAVLIASSDYEDIVHAATRAIVMVRGRVVAHLPRADISVASLTQAAGGAH